VSSFLFRRDTSHYETQNWKSLARFHTVETETQHGLHSVSCCLQSKTAEQRIEFRDRLRQNLFNVKMALYIDETHKSANASRRRRMWAKRGVPKTTDAFFEEEFRKRYMMIGACDVNGFVKEACEIVEREHDKNDRDPDRGTVDTLRFERYLEEKVKPVLGS
jgi:ribosomal protein L29